MPATIELKRNDDQQFYFHLLDSRNELLMMSAEFPSKESAEKAIADLRTGSLMSHLIAAGKVPAGESFFVIKDNDGGIIAKSILFDSQMVFDNALHTVKDSACIAPVSDLT